MRMISVGELRSKGAKVWEQLDAEGEFLVTSNGKPVAILSPVNEALWEQEIAAIRQARIALALHTVHRQAVNAGLDRISTEEIETEIQAARRERYQQG